MYTLDSRLDRVHLRRYHEYSEREALRPGVTRLNFPYFMSDETVNYVIQAVAMVAKHGWKLLPQVRVLVEVLALSVDTLEEAILRCPD